MKNLGRVTDPKDLVTKEYADGIVVANPTLAGTETDLSGIQIGNTKYKIAGEDAATREMIAPIEETSTATTAHGLGQCFVYNGVLYRALANIAVGDTITPNTNCVQTNIAMNFTRSVQLTSAQYNLLTTAEKNADILYVITDDNGGGIAPYTSNPVMDGTANPGSADAYSRGDHVHPSDTSKADKSDLASISVTGTTNTTGSTISNGTYFYLNGSLVQATADIASGATFTSGTNYSPVTAGGLNSLKSATGDVAESIFLLANSTRTINNVDIGSVILVARNSTSTKGLYVIDVANVVTPLVASGNYLPSLTYDDQNKTLTISASTAAAAPHVVVTIIKPKYWGF